MLTPTPTPDTKQTETPAANQRGPARWFRRRRLWAVAVLLGLIAAGLVWASPHVPAWYHFRAARDELQHYHNPQALRHLEACQRIWPDDPDVALLAARAERRALRYSEAGRLLDKYQRSRGLDDACSFEQLLLSAERNVDRVAEQCWRYVGQGHADSPLIYEALTRGYFRQYQLGAARMCLDRWLESEPENPQAHYLDGQYLLEYAHNESAALERFRRTVELDSDHEEARICLAVALLSSHEDPDAAESAKHLEFVRQRQPDNLSVRVGLAECSSALGRPTEAVDLVDAVLAQQPDFHPALALRGRLALDHGQFAEAETWLRAALRGDPNNYVVRYKLVLALLRNGKEEEARQQERQSKQIQDDLVRYDEIVTRDLVKKPRDPALQCELGQLLVRLGRREEGVRWLESALRDDPQYAPARQALAELRKNPQAKP